MKPDNPDKPLNDDIGDEVLDKCSVCGRRVDKDGGYGIATNSTVSLPALFCDTDCLLDAFVYYRDKCLNGGVKE